MVTDMATAEHMAMLGELVGPLREAGYPSELVAPTEEVEFPTLVVGIAGADSEPYLNVTIIPDEESIAPLSVVQLYSELPIDIEAGKDEAVTDLAAALVLATPLGAFGVADGRLFYRYMLAQRQHAAFDVDVILAMIGLIVDVFDQFGPGLEGVASGRLSVDEALRSATGGQ